MKILEDSVFCLRDHVLFAKFEEGGVIFNVKDRMSYLLNQTAAGIINLLDGKKSIKEVINKFAQLYEKQEEFVREDAENFLKNLIERDWVHVK